MGTYIRDINTPRERFIFNSERLMRLVIEEALSLLPFREVEVESPCGKFKGYQNIQKICCISILRSGEAFEGPFRQVCQGVRLGKVLIQPNEHSLPDICYENIPKDVHKRFVFLTKPTIVTGNTINLTLKRLLESHKCQDTQIVILSLFCSLQGLRFLNDNFPKVKVVTAAVDKSNNQYIPVCGQFGDRFFGT